MPLVKSITILYRRNKMIYPIQNMSIMAPAMKKKAKY